MKYSPLLFAAFIPFAGTANESSPSVDQQKLRNAVPVTEIVGQDVRSRDNDSFGEVETVALNQDGSVAYYAIEPDMGMYEEAGNSGIGDDTAVDDDGVPGDEPDVDGIADAGNVGDDDTIRVQPESIRFEQGGAIVSLDMDTQQLMREQGARGSEQVLEASDIVGMEVDLADEESFGAVEDVMISQDGSEAVALVVDNWEGADKKRRALPVELQSVSEDNETVRYDFGKDALAETGNFDLDQYQDDRDAGDADM